MPQSRTLKIMAIIVTGYFLLWAPAYFWPAYLDSPLAPILAIPYLFVYLFHGIGVPGLLEHKGACGWGWCAPTLFGWVFLIGFWLLVVWLLSRFIAKLTNTPNDKA